MHRFTIFKVTEELNCFQGVLDHSSKGKRLTQANPRTLKAFFEGPNKRAHTCARIKIIKYSQESLALLARRTATSPLEHEAHCTGLHRLAQHVPRSSNIWSHYNLAEDNDRDRGGVFHTVGHRSLQHLTCLGTTLVEFSRDQLTRVPRMDRLAVQGHTGGHEHLVAYLADNARLVMLGHPTFRL